MTTPLRNLLRGKSVPKHLDALCDDLSIKAISGDRNKGSIILEAECNRLVDKSKLSELEKECALIFGVSSFSLNVVYPLSFLNDSYFADLILRIKGIFPSINGFLDGASYSISNDNRKLTIFLSHGGADFLSNAGCNREIERIILKDFGLRTVVDFGGTTDVTFDEASREAEEFRRDAEAIIASQKTEITHAEPPKEVEKPKQANKKGEFRRPARKSIAPKDDDSILLGKPYVDEPLKMGDLHVDLGTVTVEGEVFATNHREIESRQLTILNFDVTDKTGSLRVSRAMDTEDAKDLVAAIQKGDSLLIQGQLIYNNFEHEMTMTPKNIMRTEKKVRTDTAENKRVELHMHSTMSAMDGVSDVKKLIEQAAKWGHKAVAITDHGVAQAFPDAMKQAKESNIKVIYGVEAYYVNNRSQTLIVAGEQDVPLTSEFVVFDIETTGLSFDNDRITEIGAVILRNGEACETFSAFINPGMPIPANIVELTGITDDMVKDAPTIDKVLPEFLKFVGDRVLVAHNANFDVTFIANACARLGIDKQFTYVDTLEMARILLPDLKKHKLDIVAKAVGAKEFNHHRACDDAAVLGDIFANFLSRLTEGYRLERLGEVNEALWKVKASFDTTKKRAYHHLIILVKNLTGLKNLYRLISDSHLKYFNKRPIIPRDQLEIYREGLIIGSACEAGELFEAIVRKRPWAELRRMAEFYDYLEIQPIGNNRFMLARGMASDENELRSFNETVLRLGQAVGKPVCATGDVHFLNPEDEVFRRILMAGQGFADADNQAPLYFRTTDEMLTEFAYLGQKRAYEVVVENPNKIADMVEAIRPIPEGTYPPSIEGATEDLQRLCYEGAHRIYGEPLCKEIAERIEAELQPIINNGFAVMYMSAQKLIKKSNDAGYLVGSRGSVGSSVVAYFCGISEVNPLPPHYHCESCHHIEFGDSLTYGCGGDMPDKECPRCHTKMQKDGFNIPFFTFLGFKAEKEPDIDLNFSGEYQTQAHKDCVELFGEGQVFKAGTIGTVKDKTAYGYVRKYCDERGLNLSKAEINRLTIGCTGVKRTTGQHPGGLIIVPRDRTIYEFCPVQHPADDTNSDIITTHFDFHSIHDNLLKLDMLGHDNPTIIKHLEDMTGVNATTIPLDDPRTIGIFTDISNLYDIDDKPLEADELLGKTGVAAVPEFGTQFARGMLLDTKPKNFDGLVRISGLSHGTDVWMGNAADLIKDGVATLEEVISARDDITMFLIGKGMDASLAFKTSEAIRKGKGIIPETVAIMQEKGVPQWYIDSCQKIKYLYPKAHAVAYVLMAFRIAWFKVHYPLPFYSSYFSIRAVGFDANTMTKGIETVKKLYHELDSKPDATANEKDTVTTLEVVYEFYKRGFSFQSVDLYRSDAEKFLIEGNTLLPPLTSLPGLGLAAAQNIVEERKNGVFSSISDFDARCSKVSKAVIEILEESGALKGIPKSDQIGMFDL